VTGNYGDAVDVAVHDGIMVITINRPQARNAINAAVSDGIGAALEAAQADRAVRVIILTGAGERAFCAGADLKALARGELPMPSDPDHRAWGFAGYVTHHIDKPTIAAVNGLALGGGTELVLASDLAVAADTATFGLPEVRRGIMAGAGGAFRLPRQVPLKVAMEMLLTGRTVDAQTALEVKLVNEVVAAHELMDAAHALADDIMRGAPLAVQASKRIARGIVDGGVAAEMQLWSASLRESRALRRSRDAREGVQAFVEGREPKWQGE
jgi:crotonobetainyl-CoA hydratase